MLEAQLCAMRDIDYGIFPFTSSSNTLAAYAPLGAGIPNCRLDHVVGVLKAYSTCVGAGPFAAENAMGEAWNEKLRTAGGEYGAATGRPRRVGPSDLVAGRCLRKLLLPAPLEAAYTAFRSIRFLWKGVRCVLSRRLEVEVLDALSIGVSLLRGDFGTAGSVMFLLNLGSLLEEWTRKKSLDDLARSMALNVDKVWVRAQGTEVLMPLTKVHPGDEIVVRSGNMIPLDGTVIEGEAMVNQAALTGESMPVRKITGATVYAGTVVEEGECVLVAKAEGSANRYAALSCILFML